MHDDRAVSHQTVKLSRGSHHGPHDGACVMELASMLAGERFTDRPATACPVIAEVLRAYNDAVDDERRQQLLPYAAAVVGTRATAEIERRRAQRCVVWALEVGAERATWWRWGRRRPPRAAEVNPCSVFPRYVSAVVRRPDDALHRRVLALVDELIAIGAPDGGTLVALAPPPGPGRRREAKPAPA
jgi:hypothetical protein